MRDARSEPLGSVKLLPVDQTVTENAKLCSWSLALRSHLTSEEPDAFNAALAELFAASENGRWLAHKPR